MKVNYYASCNGWLIDNRYGQVAFLSTLIAKPSFSDQGASFILISYISLRVETAIYSVIIFFFIGN